MPIQILTWLFVAFLLRDAIKLSLRLRVLVMSLKITDQKTKNQKRDTYD